MSAQQQFLHRLSDYEIDQISSSTEMEKSKLWVKDRVRHLTSLIKLFNPSSYTIAKYGPVFLNNMKLTDELLRF